MGRDNNKSEDGSEMSSNVHQRRRMKIGEVTTLFINRMEEIVGHDLQKLNDYIVNKFSLSKIINTVS